MDKKTNRSVLVNLDLGNSKVPFKVSDEDRWFYDLDIFKKRNDYTQETVDRIMNQNDVTN